jgi:hypothetical protein
MAARSAEPSTGIMPAGAYWKCYRQFGCVAGREGGVGNTYTFDAVDSVGPDFSRLSLDCVDEEVASFRVAQGVWLNQARGPLVDEKVVGAGEADLLEWSGSGVDPLWRTPWSVLGFVESVVWNRSAVVVGWCWACGHVGNP